jgi:hypothetical protein
LTVEAGSLVNIAEILPGILVAVGAEPAEASSVGLAHFHSVTGIAVVTVGVEEAVDALIIEFATQFVGWARIIPGLAPEQRITGLAPVTEEAVVAVNIDGDILAGVAKFVTRVVGAFDPVITVDG